MRCPRRCGRRGRGRSGLQTAVRVKRWARGDPTSVPLCEPVQNGSGFVVTALPPPNSLTVTSRAAWRAWLAAHHTEPGGVWLVTFKKASGKPRPSYNDVVEEALCFGWVDSLGRKLDGERTMLYFAPRKAGSGWSRPNKERIERLVASGQMTAAGLEKVEAAKRDGSWTVLDAVERLELPPDLVTALDERPGAAANFAAFPRSAKRGILEWIANAKRPETRARRVSETATLAARNERANSWRGRR